MKYLLQFLVILIFVVLGEILEMLIPLPIAGSIYGLLLLFIFLCLKIVKLEWVSDVADWLHSIMALFFVAPAVAIVDIWKDISDVWYLLVLLLILAYIITMITTGLISDYLLKKSQCKGKHK